MAQTENKQTGSKEPQGQTSDKIPFGGKRGQRKNSGTVLNDGQKLARREMQSARSALRQMLDRLGLGKNPIPEVIEACGLIKSAAARVLMD